MALRLIDETAAQTVLEISGGGALIGIGGAADSVQILAVCGQPIIKSNGLVYDARVVASSGATASGTVALDGNGVATVSTAQPEPVVIADSSEVWNNTAGSFNLHGAAGGNRTYCIW